MTENRLTVTVTIDGKKVTLEGPEEFVRAEVRRLTTPTSPDLPERESRTAGAPTESEIIAQKRPRNHSEIVTCLALALKESGLDQFTERDMRRAYIRAKLRPPKVVAQALRDAKNNFDYLESGTKRGHYRISAHGERTVVVDLPRKST